MTSSNNDPNEELDTVQRQINSKTNESLESTRRMVGLAAESQEIGVNTLVMLDEQGEQLNRIDGGLDNIHIHMNEAEKNLTQLQKCCGLFVLPWQRVRRRPLMNSNTSITSERSSTTTTKEPRLAMMPADGIPSNGYITRVTNDNREDEMDDNLQLVHSYLGNLKSMAVDMGDTLGNQNKQLENMKHKTDVQDNRINAANKTTQNLIRRA